MSEIGRHNSIQRLISKTRRDTRASIKEAVREAVKKLGDRVKDDPPSLEGISLDIFDSAKEAPISADYYIPLDINASPQEHFLHGYRCALYDIHTEMAAYFADQESSEEQATNAQ